MKQAVLYLCGVTLLPAFAGCVSKAEADQRVRAAYLAGQQQAIAQLQIRGAIVTVSGEVRNNIVPWTPGLTLAQALLTAEYLGPSDPAEIIIRRGEELIRVDPKGLLGGEDVPLQARDIIELRR